MTRGGRGGRSPPLGNFEDALRTKIEDKKECEETLKCKYPGINGPFQQDMKRQMMIKIKQFSKHPPEPKHKDP